MVSTILNPNCVWTNKCLQVRTYVRHRKVVRRLSVIPSLFFLWFLCVWSFQEVGASSTPTCYVNDPQVGLMPDITQVGAFHRRKNVKSLRDCARHCCSVPNCDLALYTDRLCFLTDCSFSATVCQPQQGDDNTEIALVTRNSTSGSPSDASVYSKHTNSRHKGSSPSFIDYSYLHGTSYLNLLNYDFDEDDLSIYATSLPPNTNPEFQRENWDPCFSYADCRDNERCFKLPDANPLEEGLCICKDHYIFSKMTQSCMLQNAFYTVQRRAQAYNPDWTPETNVQRSRRITEHTEKNSADNADEHVTPPQSQQATANVKAPSTTVPQSKVTEEKEVEHTTEKGAATIAPPVVDADERDHTTKTVPQGAGLAPGVATTVAPVPPDGDQKSNKTVVELTVSAGQNKELQLPDENSVNLHTYVIPEDPPNGGSYSYKWDVLSSPDDPDGTSAMKPSGPEMVLSSLKAGHYMLKIQVSAPSAEGVGYINVTVHPPPRQNTPPVAKVSPSNDIEMIETKETILDASKSSDDTDELTYLWEEIEGPVNSQLEPGTEAIYTLQNMKPGFYQFRLTVTDIDGASDSAVVNVTVKEEDDNAPIANAGADQVIHLPMDSVTLNGNGSTDDHGITKWEWSKLDGGLADISGSSEPVLKVSELQEGTYTFQLTVYDRKDQKDTASVFVHVLPEDNQPPHADAGPDKELSLPDDSTTLEGGASTDDLGIITYEWTKVKGPDKEVTIANGDTAEATVSGLVAGTYTFKLTVTDAQGETDSDTTQVVVKEEVNLDPVANAGKDVTIELPKDYVELNGTLSRDDKGIVSYSWTRGANSSASGVFVGNSQHSPILKVSKLVEGKYVFNLTVADAKGRTSWDPVNVHVNPDPLAMNLVELVFNEDVSSFEENDKNDLVVVLNLLTESDVVIQEITHTTSGRLVVIFYGTNRQDKSKVLPGPQIVQSLKDHNPDSDKKFFKYQLLSYDTVICQNPCSNHGVCNKYSRKCSCETFWMENFFRVNLGDGQSNCDWSILYVIIIGFLITLLVGLIVWFLTCCFRRKRKKSRRKQQYSLLTEDLEGHDTVELLPKANGNVLDKLTDLDSAQGKQNSSIMVSASGEDTDDEITVYEHRKKRNRSEKKPLNGHIKRSKRYPARTEKL